MDNFIRMNDWPIKNFIWFILFIQIGIWGLGGLELIGINISFLREIVGFIYLVFVPGMILLRILRLHKLSNIEVLLYSIALSIATLMFTGLIINFSLPILGIDKPISFVPLMLSINLVTLFLLILSYYIDKDFTQPDLDIKISSKHLFLTLPLFLSIFGTYLINYHNNNLGIIFMIITIAVIIFLAGFNKIDKNLYSFVILIISISLLFQNSLISNYISGFDIQREYFLAKLVIYNFKWETVSNLELLTDLNSILSVTILPSYFYYICNMNIVWIFKIMYPLMFSLVPLGLYELFKRQFNSKIAFFAVIYFVATYGFFYNMPQLMRQIIAEIFIVAILLLFLDKKMDKRSRSILLIVFLFSLTISHYGVAHIFLTVVIGVYLLQYLFNLYKKSEINTVNSTIVFLFLSLVLLWYIYNNDASVFISILRIFDRVYSSLLTSFLSPNSTQGLAIIGAKVTLFNAVTKYLYLLTQFLILIGIAGFLFIGSIGKRFKIKKEYLFFAIIFMGICIVSILVPNFSSQLDTVRMYHLTLLVLSPFFIMGFMLITEKISKFLKSDKGFHKTFNIISIFLVIFLFLNTGLIQGIINEPYKPTMAFNTNDPPVFNEKDTSSAAWLSTHMNKSSKVYSDINGFVLLGGFVGPGSQLLSFSLDKNAFNDLTNSSYLYLRHSTLNGTINVAQDSINGSREGFIDQKFLDPINKNRNIIYDNNITILF